MDLTALYDTYSKERVDKAVELLTYKKVDPLPKEESDDYPVMYIFRHGQSTDNAEFIFSGWRDSDITQKGVEQAEVLAPKLKDKNIGMLVSSDQIRAIRTMEITIAQNEVAKKLEIIKDPRIKERGYGLLEGHSKLELYLWNEKLLHAFRRGYDVVPPEGESLKMVCARVKEFCDEIIPLIKKTSVNVAISCHGNSIRGFRKYFEKLSDQETAHVETPLGKDYAAYVIK
jgi:2,3-bisphosphoglycerate-dependent phosphoglycerate mutase